MRYLSSPSLVVPHLSESLQTSSVKPGTSRAAQGVGTHMSLYQHPGEGRQVDRHTNMMREALWTFNCESVPLLQEQHALQKIYSPCVLFILQCNTLLDPI